MRMQTMKSSLCVEICDIYLIVTCLLIRKSANFHIYVFVFLSTDTESLSLVGNTNPRIDNDKDMGMDINKMLSHKKKCTKKRLLVEIKNYLYTHARMETGLNKNFCSHT